MELRGVCGIGRATEEKLMAAGISTAAELAWVDNLDDLAQRSGISVSRLASLRLEAARADHRPIPPPRRALRRFFETALKLGELMKEKMRTRAPGS